MKFKISRSNFFKTLSHLQGIVDRKNSLPILSNILIEAEDNKLVLSSTDMDISIIEKINCAKLISFKIQTYSLLQQQNLDSKLTKFLALKIDSKGGDFGVSVLIL